MNMIHHHGQSRSSEKAIPGCLGRMVNLFDFNAGLAANKLLTDKPHRDGSPLARSHSDIARLSPTGNQLEDKAIASEFRKSCSNRKPNGTPMKKLIDQEMSKELDSKRSPPNVVAKLMGLDALPRQEPDSTAQRLYSRGHPRSQSDIPMSCWEQQYGDSNEYKDVYEVWQQPKKTDCVRERSPRKGRSDETSNEKRMALVRQKFVEAKRLSMDEKLRHSKQFQDALEVLSSNRDLFLKCLQEPNSLLSQHFYNLQSIPPPPGPKRITVLKPSKVVESDSSTGVGNKDGKQIKQGIYLEQVNGTKKSHVGSSPQASTRIDENPTGKPIKHSIIMDQLNGLEESNMGCSPQASRKIDEIPTQPTRIVLLKPSCGKLLDIKAVSSPQSESSRKLHSEDFFGDVEDDEIPEREVARTVTEQMREKLGRHHREETVLSSVFSNGYVGDESSFNKSELGYSDGHLSDSEVMSPISRHSWDYVNRFCSPYSPSSFSRGSCSPESSVCREAKKRLSERWAIMASNGSRQEQRNMRRSSSTLGEMLALSEIKKPGMHEEPKELKSLFDVEQKKDENLDNSPKNLSRSKSVPVSSTEFGTRLDVAIPDPCKSKLEVQEEATKERNGKSSFKGKVSSLFFPRSKKHSKTGSSTFDTTDRPHASGEHHGQTGDDRTGCLGERECEQLPPCVQELSSKASSSNPNGNNSRLPAENGLFVTKPGVSGSLIENQDQPSPISVLDPPFPEEEVTVPESSQYIKPDQNGHELSVHPIKSNLLDKSPPIGSIARTLSWDDSCMETASSYPLKSPLPAEDPEEEEREWFSFVEMLLSIAGFNSDMQFNSFLAKWHSPESPLDFSLRDNYIDLKDKETLHEAKRRRKRSTLKLVFDCVNAALLDIAEYRSDSSQRTIPCMTGNGNSSETISLAMMEEVWSRIKIWFSGEARLCGEYNSLVVEGMVRKEVVGKGWTDHLRLEVDHLGKEIEGKLLEELVQDAVVELTGRL